MAKHHDIHAILLARITSGLWAPGAPIPNEADLAREFACTRPTIARALGDLVAAGLIERRRRAGSRVVERRARDILLTIPLVRAEIERSGRAYGYRLIDRAEGTAPDPVRARLGPDPALHVRCLHLADSRPHQLEDRWINLATVPGARDQDFTAQSPNEWLVRAIPYTGAEHVLAAVAATEAEAAHLGIRETMPVFVIERTTWLGTRPVTHVRLTHPGESFRLIARDAGPS